MTGDPPKTAAEPGRRPLWRAAGVAAFVTIAAPLIAALFYLAAAVVRTAGGEFSGVGEARGSDIAASVAQVAYLIVFFAFALGGIAAAVSGLALAHHVYFGDGAVSLKRALITALAGMLLNAVALRIGLGTPLPFIATLLPPALASAVVCRWLMQKLGLILATA